MRRTGPPRICFLGIRSVRIRRRQLDRNLLSVIGRHSEKTVSNLMKDKSGGSFHSVRYDFDLGKNIVLPESADFSRASCGASARRTGALAPNCSLLEDVTKSGVLTFRVAATRFSRRRRRTDPSDLFDRVRMRRPNCAKLSFTLYIVSKVYHTLCGVPSRFSRSCYALFAAAALPDRSV